MIPVMAPNGRCMTVYWPVFFGSAAALFVALNAVFGFLYSLGHEPIANAAEGWRSKWPPPRYSSHGARRLTLASSSYRAAGSLEGAEISESIFDGP